MIGQGTRNDFADTYLSATATFFQFHFLYQIPDNISHSGLGMSLSLTS